MDLQNKIHTLIMLQKNYGHYFIQRLSNTITSQLHGYKCMIKI